jgi:hypothetical protein
MGHDKLFQKTKKLTRKQNTRSVRRMLIVCEGEKTEPNYFRTFPDNPAVFDALTIEGQGYNTVSLVNEAIRLKHEAQQKREPYSEVWCVFDKDSFSIELFFNAIFLAGKNQIHCAYSIEAFEIWYLLHFSYIDAGLSRSQYQEKLNNVLGKTYIKNAPDMYSTLLKRQPTAIHNASKLYALQSTLSFTQQNPVTTVFQLVKRLNGSTL